MYKWYNKRLQSDTKTSAFCVTRCAQTLTQKRSGFGAAEAGVIFHHDKLVDLQLTKKLTKNSSTTLDLFRAISSQLVVIGHGVSFCGIAVSLHLPNFPWMQNIAVVIFFILSGFLISYSLGRKKNNDDYKLPHYIVDRFSRIYVAFIPALFFVFLVDSLSLKINGELFRYEDNFNIRTFIGNVFMLQDFPTLNFVSSFGSARPLWTLAIEWWIYIYVGVLFFSFKKNPIKSSSIIFIILLSFVPIYNLFGGRGNGLTLYWVYGFLAFYIWNTDILRKFSLIQIMVLIFILTLTLTLTLTASYTVISTLKEYYPLFALYLSGVILLCIEASSRIKFHDWIRSYSKFFSTYSYTLYLIHYSIFDLLVTYYGGGYITFLFGFFASNISAYILGRLLEVTATKYVKNSMYGLLNRFPKNITIKFK